MRRTHDVMIYLTPSSISHLNQFILAFVITAYLGWHFILHKTQRPSTADQWLAFFFTTVTGLSLVLFLQVSTLPSERLMAIYTLNTILALLLLTLIQFAYFFPQPSEKQKIERQVALFVTSAYTLLEFGVAVWRFSLLRQGQVVYRPPGLEYVPVALFVWAIFVFGRGTVQNRHQPASRRFALIFLIPLGLTLLYQMLYTRQISPVLYYISSSVGILATIFLFALNYLVAQPEKTSLMVKFSGGILTAGLSVFGVVAWLVTPAYVDQYPYRPGVLDHRTIRFTPNRAGGYDVTEIPFHFESERGQNLGLSDNSTVPPGYYEAAFAFPFYGQTYPNVFITNNGLLTFGQPESYFNLEYRLSKAPIFFALGLDLNPEASSEGGVFLRQEPDRLIITYDHLWAYYAPEQYTFQVVLAQDGQIDLTFNGLPSGPHYQLDDRYDASIWMIGPKPPGFATRETIHLDHLPLTTGPQGALDDQYRAFRQYVDTFLTPLALAILVSSLLFLFGLPLTLNVAMARPLRTLLAGVEQFNAGKNHQPIPIQFNDEVGFLTQSFNHLTSELDSLIQTLETRVAHRTADLLATNTELRKLSIIVEQSPSAIVITNLNANIEYINPAFTRVSGYSFEEVKGKNPRVLQSGETPPETFQEMWRTLLGGQTWRGELVNRRKNGELYWEETVIAPIQDAEGTTTYYVSIKEDITARKNAERELERLATTDPLTGLLNRRSFFAEAEKIFSRSLHPPFELAVLMLDVDHFKKINDHYGHQVGDMVLREVAACLLENVRPTDVLARYGGEEFVALLPRIPLATLAPLAERLNAAIREKAFTHHNIPIAVTISIGAALLTCDRTSLDELLSQADQALYQAKQTGRDRAIIWRDTATLSKGVITNETP